MEKLRADLHTHTYYSDGRQSPDDVIDAALRTGVRLIAVTDHDTMLGCDRAAESARDAHVRYVRGLEVSAYAGDVKFHTLGYGMDEDKFAGFLTALYENSIRRAEDVIGKLNAAGIRMTVEDAAAERRSDRAPIHGMHIARAGVKRGYAPTPFAFFGEYLARGKTGFSCVGRPSPEDTCGAIAAAGGFSVVAHPGRVEMTEEELKKWIVRLKGFGLGGIEVYYTTHTVIQTAYYKRLAEELSLEATGGSDTHYSGGRNRIGEPAFFAGDSLRKRLKIEE